MKFCPAFGKISRVGEIIDLVEKEGSTKKITVFKIPHVTAVLRGQDEWDESTKQKYLFHYFLKIHYPDQVRLKPG